MPQILRLERLLPLLFAVGLCAPAGAVTLVGGDIVVVDAGRAAPAVPARVIRISPTTGAQTVVASGGFLVAPVAIAVDANRSILVADSGLAGDGVVIRINPANGSQTVLSGPYPGLLGLTIRPSDGSIYVTDAEDNAVYLVDPVSGDPTPVSSGGQLGFPQAITSAPDGFLYVGDFSTAWRILQVEPTPPNGAQDPFAAGFQYVGGLAASVGALWVADSLGGAIARVDLGTGNSTPVASGGDLIFPFGVAVEANGALVVADWGSSTDMPAVVRVAPANGSQSVVSPGGFLVEPWGIAVVAAPEASMSLLGLGALGALAALSRRSAA